MTNLLITTNRTQNKVRRETFGGREYMIAPVVAIRAGVLNNELVPVDEIGKFVEAWNGIPLPLGHPKENGAPISANSPVVEAGTVGRFWNAQMDGDRLRGEIWVDVEKAKALGGDAIQVMEKLEKGEGIEVSTAYFRDLEEKPGSQGGIRYYGIARNLRPDHLALLLHEVGACSWKDGCGVPRINNQQTQKLVMNQHTGVMIALFPALETAQQLALNGDGMPDGAQVLPASELHLTLAYLGDLEAGEVKADQAQVLREVMNFASNNPIVRGMISGVGRFTNNPTEQALFALYDCPYLHGLRYWLTDWLPVRSNGQGFIPHITLAYLPADAPMPNVLPEPREIIFDRIGVAWGGQVTLFPLQGEVAVAANEERSFNPITMVKNALRGLAQGFGFKKAPQDEHQDQDPVAPPDGPINNSTPEGGNTQTEEVSTMEKSKLIEKLVSNASCPFDKAELEAMPETALVKLSQKLEGGCTGNTPATNAAQPLVDDLKALSNQVQALASAFQEVGGAEGLKSALASVTANANQRKTALVAELKGNSRCAFSEQDLQAMPVEQLEKLAASLTPADYSGRGGPRGNAQAAGDQIPDMPSILLAKQA